MTDSTVNLKSLFDAKAYWHSGQCPWTIFAYPTCLADENGLPADAEAQRFLAEIQRRGIQVGIWVNGIAEDTSYFAVPKEDIQRVHFAIQELEEAGVFEPNFCGKRSDHLLSLRNRPA